MKGNHEKLGYIGDDKTVSKITHLTYPIPHYLKGEGYRKCEPDGRVFFYIELTEEEKL